MAEPQFVARTLADLYALKRLSGLNSVRLETGRIKRRGGLRHALLYGLWALAPGGRLEIADDGPDALDPKPFELPFSFVKQQSFKLLAGRAIFEALDKPSMTLTFVRTLPEPEDGWTCAVMFSGSESELPVLNRCLEGLFAQATIQSGNGEVMVVGPSAGARFFAGDPRIRYLPFDTVATDRIPISAKKNAAIAAARFPRVLVCHARIVLDPDCLERLPPMFDVITPRVVFRHKGQDFPYLDWIPSDNIGLRTAFLRPRRGIGYDRSAYLDQLAGGAVPFIDGGVFAVRKDVGLVCPLNPAVAWAEAEDMEWCERLQSLGYLVDLDPEATASSQTYKLGRRSLDYPQAARLLGATWRLVGYAASLVRRTISP